MDTLSIQCLESFAQFQSVQSDWDAFTGRHFPGNYHRTHAWLSAWWTTYHCDRPAFVYIQRRLDDGCIVAAAPLFVRKENFSGFPILSLQSLGVGIGTDDFLEGPGASGFAEAVLRDLVQHRRWHVARLRRLASTPFCAELRQACVSLSLPVDDMETDDYYIDFPASYPEYLQSRTRKFRRNLNQAANRLDKEGAVTIEILDPIAEPDRVASIGREVSSTSWQFLEGKSHFNDTGSDSFYANLARTAQGAGGEEFTALMVEERPVAYLLGCLRERTYYAVDTAFHADFRNVSAGRLLFSRIIERLITEGLADNLDFEGDGEYKDDYATDSRKVSFFAIYNRSLYPRLVRSLRSSRMHAALGKFLKRS